jgi:cation diffusion facilitator family transporter
VSTSTRRSSGLSMHMGHSHGHNQHSHEEERKVEEVPTTFMGHVRALPRRRMTRVLFCGLAILIPALVRNKGIKAADWALFGLTSAILGFADATRREIKGAISRANQMRMGILKHAPTGDSLSNIWRKENAADRVTLVGVVINLFLSIGKFGVGISCHSSALIADAGHSLSDLFSDFITLWAVQVGRIPPDDDHPYGHGKFESVGSLFLALTLLGTGLSVGAASNKKLMEIIQLQRLHGWGAAASLVGQVPTSPALLMAGISIVSKEWLFRVTRKVGESLNSQIVIANAWHHRSDAYSSVLALISIGLAMTVPGFLAADAAAGLLVAGMICMTGAEILGESVKQLTDTTNEELVRQIEKITIDCDDVTAVKRVRARQVGSTALVDVSLTTSEGMSASAIRAVEERLRARILEEQPGVLDAEVHAAGPHVHCPLLAATEFKELDQQKSSPTRVEENARRVMLLHSGVRSVEAVTVHYIDTTQTSVDVTIRVDPDLSVATAHRLAQDVRTSLQQENSIDKASIFLDLNEDAHVLTP